MTPERWQRIRPILDRALELHGEERAAFLLDRCGDDGALRADIETLLRAEARVGPPLDAPVGEYADALVAEMTEAAARGVIGHRIGAYRVVREIGRGGMGQVFLAERVDGGFQQRVAIKLLRPGAEGEEPDRRFRIERQILAGLGHPHIARLLDGGLTEDGRPFFVMEYIDGTPIHHYCEERGLDIARRLALFIDVCDAVQYAHGNLIVHRDLKPANVLVAGDGQVKVLDFGIAKLLAAERSDLTLPETRPGQYCLTPEYAAPEQVRGESITTATDVYQLGVVLYELLTGRRPFDASGASRHDIERAVIESEPGRPSIVAAHRGGAGPDGGVGRWSVRRVAARRRERVDRRLRGDLDAIVLKALRKEPELRYASPGALADDVRRHLDGRPVEARGGAAVVPTPPVVPTPAGRTARAGGAPRRRRSWQARWAGIAALVVAATLVARTLWRGPDPVASPTAVAVLPFSVSGGVGYDYLAEGMVDLLSRSLDGAGELRAIDPATVLRRVGGAESAGPLDPARGRELAARLGAGLYVIGSIHGVGSRLRVHASLGGRDDTRPPIPTTAEGDTTALFEIVDELAAKLATAGQGRRFSARAIQSAGRTASSLTALKAFLAAEHELRGARYDAAIEGFERAVGEDSTFALAWYRMALARIWAASTGITATYAPLDRALSHSARMSGRDRRLLEALVASVKGSPSEAEQRYRAILDEYPGDLETQYQLAVLLFRHNPLVGRPASESRRLFERVLADDPEFLCPI